MGYFKELPDLEYRSPFSTYRNSVNDYVKCKNLFKRLKLRDDVYNNVTNFDKYIISEGERPDQVALNYYGDDTLDYVILIVNNISNLRNEWPLSGEYFYNFLERKYPQPGRLSEIHHYETLEVRDSQDKLILPSGKWVDSNFTIPNPNNKQQTINPVKPITILAHEQMLNDKKSEIWLLRPEYIGIFLDDLRTAYTYGISSQQIDENTKRGA